MTVAAIIILGLALSEHWCGKRAEAAINASPVGAGDALEQEYRHALFHLCQVTCRLSSNDCTLKSSFHELEGCPQFYRFFACFEGLRDRTARMCHTRWLRGGGRYEKSQLPCSCHLSSLSLRAHHAGCLDSTGTKRDDRPWRRPHWSKIAWNRSAWGDTHRSTERYRSREKCDCARTTLDC